MTQQAPSAADVLVSTDWVAEHGKDQNVRLVEVDVDTKAYDTGHIAGAVGWNWKTDTQDTLRRNLPTPEQLQDLLRRAGISAGTTVILYGDNNNWFAAYALWLLKYYGHHDVRLINGGRTKWIAEGRELTTDVPTYPASTYTVKQPNKDIRALRDLVLDNVNKAGAVLVDVRSPKEFSGELLAPRTCRRKAPSAAATSPAPSTSPGPRPWPRTPPSRRRPSCARCMAARASPATRTSSPIAASASARRTPGSCSSICWAIPTCATTTARGPSGGPWSTCPSPRVRKIQS